MKPKSYIMMAKLHNLLKYSYVIDVLSSNIKNFRDYIYLLIKDDTVLSSLTSYFISNTRFTTKLDEKSRTSIHQ